MEQKVDRLARRVAEGRAVARTRHIGDKGATVAAPTHRFDRPDSELLEHRPHWS